MGAAARLWRKKADGTPERWLGFAEILDTMPNNGDFRMRVSLNYDVRCCWHEQDWRAETRMRRRADSKPGVPGCMAVLRRVESGTLPEKLRCRE